MSASETVTTLGLKVEGLRYESEGFRLGPLDFQLPPGQILTVFGPNGAGKSTLLRLLAGLEPPAGGRVWLEGREITQLAGHLRGVGMVFQDLALFPHLSVWENIAYGPRARRWPEADVSSRVDRLLEEFRLDRLAERRPGQLSGGEQQRVALARALAPKPRLLLFDEPLSSADREIRWTLQREIRERVRTDKIPAIYVTHDLEEGMALAARMAFLDGGRWRREGPIDEVRRNPRSRFVARFLGLNVHPRGPSWMATDPSRTEVVRRGSPNSTPGRLQELRREGELLHLRVSLETTDPPVLVDSLRWGETDPLELGGPVGVLFREEILLPDA